MAKTVLVTGAMGQLGKRVTALLLARGYQVVALDLRNEKTLAVTQELAALSSRLQPAYVNLLDAAAVRALVVECQPDVVIHLAAIVSPPCYHDIEMARRVNVDGTRRLLDAVQTLDVLPFFVFASSCSVYGSRNPHLHPERVTAYTPVNPVECYGEHKVEAEKMLADSGLPHAILRLGGIISPDGTEIAGPEYFLLMRATPIDNRVHAVDARDAALAFVNAAESAPAIDGKILLIGGDDSYVLLQSDLQDDIMQALGIGRLGPCAGLPGDPEDEFGWGLTDWFDTRQAQQLLDFQRHDWQETLAWLGEAQGSKRTAMAVMGPLIRVLLRSFLILQRRWEKRGAYANPWALVSRHFGTHVLAPAPRQKLGS